MPNRVRDSFRDKREYDDDSGINDDYSPEDAYSPWKKGNLDGFLPSLSKNSGLLFVILGAGVFIMIALFIFLPMLRSPGDTRKLTEMEARIKKIEDKLVELDQNYQKVALLAVQDDKLEQISARLDKMGTSTAQRIDQLAKDFDLNRRQSSPAKTEAASKQPVSPKPAAVLKPPAAKTRTAPRTEPAEPKTESAAQRPSTPTMETASPSSPVETTQKSTVPAKIHVVQPRETLYGISHKYGITLQELRRINNMGPNDLARSGQKLKVSP